VVFAVEAELRGDPGSARHVLGPTNLEDGPATGVVAQDDVTIEHGDEGVDVPGRDDGARL